MGNIEALETLDINDKDNLNAGDTGWRYQCTNGDLILALNTDNGAFENAEVRTRTGARYEQYENRAEKAIFKGAMRLTGITTSPTGLTFGCVWSDNGVLKIV